MSNFKIRLEQEQKELQIKIDALQSFINDNDDFIKVGVAQNILLKHQLNVMRSYNEILTVRLVLIGK